MLNAGQRRGLLGLALLALALFTALSLLPLAPLGDGVLRTFPTGNLMGVLGRLFAAGALAALGAGAVLVPLVPAIGGAAALGWIPAEKAARRGLLVLGLIFLLPVGLALATPASGVAPVEVLPVAAAGWVGTHLGLLLIAGIGWLGTLLLLLFLAASLALATTGWNPVDAYRRRGGPEAGVRLPAGRATDGAAGEPALHGAEAEEPDPFGDDHGELAAAGLVIAGGVLAADAAAAAGAAAAGVPLGRGGPRIRRVDPGRLEDFGDPDSTDRFPLDLLAAPPPRDPSLSDAELDRLGQVLLHTLRTFKVESEIVGRTTGPVVTQYEVVPAPGIKVNRIAALDADLALALRAPSVRIVAPIPGKGAVGVDVPNPQPEVVPLRTILESPAFQRHRGQLPVALGKDLTGKPYVADLARMPHLLIAGATGSGKSVCINTLITSLVYRHTPRDLRLLMVDPKMVELSMYGDLPHLRHPVVTDPHDAATVLKWAVLEMERRYELLSENGARSLSEFNRRQEEGQTLRRAEPKGADDDPDRWLYTDGPLPFIVLVVDELADLMMSVQAEIEKPLAQLAQKARAIGIHLVVATQRPSVNVITGLIKANFPCRIAFRVSSKVDSRTILDQNGADALLGNGDMLFMPPGQSDPVRIQGAFLSTEETDRMMGWYREAADGPPAREEDILQVVREREAVERADDVEEYDEERDALFRQAAEVCIQFQQGSTSLLQRRLRIGYGRAARVIDQLHHAGVIGAPDGSKPREVLVGLESLNAICGDG
jgi:DNA segregation ATPase FtsK/SpoIIIE, S-DNA-T family